ncbi:MAG: ABC transporter substrate-binding protein [Myxococcales bacterium]|nr:ABC transporter substrate-binding protein [Myxococcales bacterium]
MPKTLQKSWIALFALILGLLVPMTASAGEATDTVKAKQAQLFDLVAQPKSEARQSKLQTLFDSMLAYDRFAKGSLGDEWDARSDAEKKRFTELLTELVRNNYKRNLKKMLDYQIAYSAEETDGEATIVKTLAKHKSDARAPELEIDFRLETIGGTLKVVDIVTEQASLVKTYRVQFLKILRKKGFDKLISKMQKKLDKLKAKET